MWLFDLKIKIMLMVHCFLTGWMITPPPPHHLFLHYVTSVRGGGSQRYTHVYFSIHNSDMTKWVLFVVSTWQTVTDFGFVFLTVVWHPVTCGRVANHTKCQLQGACVCASEFICSCVLDTHCFLKITFHLALTDNSFWCIVLFFPVIIIYSDLIRSLHSIAKIPIC